MSKSKEEEILEYVIKLIDKRIPKKPNVSHSKRRKKPFTPIMAS